MPETGANKSFESGAPKSAADAAAQVSGSKSTRAAAELDTATTDADAARRDLDADLRALREDVARLGETVASMAQARASALDEAVHRNPWSAVVAAVCVGFCLGLKARL
ncbi:MAG: DUF883 family protein [Inquilinus limosus]|uniref:DUF883 family protein n=1 Tax=Inquilinus limosus TaxID=171674 RepID=A0A952FW64_9PROT|nr:DUF883 family protein [Inquilinus limosus]